ncbi:MAG: hypothetical protein A2X86_05750 [Bdellovibrionales bacterium GWA2_49_15]|nr:MAG: hypothetical protein A2X86_05750 [Bdellovibrionales bacterium GWA2_49_15]
MIEINLLEQKKPFKLPVIMGVDLAAVNYKAILLAFLLSYVPDWFLYPVWEEELQSVAKEKEILNEKLQKLEADVRGNDVVKKQLDLFNNQVAKLKERSTQVEQIIKQRTNPNKILERVARNIPEDMWLTELFVDGDRKVSIHGMSTSYKSIGNFIILLNESLFFGKSLTLSDSKTEEDKDEGAGKRIEVFTIQGRVESYDPLQQ